MSAAGSERRSFVPVVFVAEALLAGGNGVAIRFSNRELPPLWGASLRFVVAALIALAVTAMLRPGLPRGRALTGTLLYGLVQFAGGFGLVYYALVHIHAGLGQTILALVPLATLLLAVLIGQERLTGAAVAGTLLGLIGVALISRDPLRASVPLLALLAVLGGVLCFAAAAVIVRRFPPVHPLAMNAVGMAAGAVVLLAASTIAGDAQILPRERATWIALAYVAAIGSVVVFMCHVFVLHNWPASRAAYVMVLIPFVTVVLSSWLDDERIGGGLVVGGLLVIAGVYIGALRRRSPPARDHATLETASTED